MYVIGPYWSNQIKSIFICMALFIQKCLTEIKNNNRKEKPQVKSREENYKNPTRPSPQTCTETYTLKQTIAYTHADTQTHTLIPTRTLAVTKETWLGSETLRRGGSYLWGGQPHWERSWSKAAERATTGTTPTWADRRPHTMVRSPLTAWAETAPETAPPTARPETTPSLAGPHEETQEIKNWQSKTVK